MNPGSDHARDISMTTIRTVLADAARRLDSRADADLLMAHVLDRSRGWLFAHADDRLGDDAAQAFDAALARRLDGEPVAYITGSSGFWSLDLRVTPATLIPRPETELLVELALQRLPAGHDCMVADLGTGSGAIALAIASERPCARVLATDASADALAIARANARRTGLDRVRFARGDWCAPLRGRCFDLIVSNPPYIEADDPHLERGDLRFEPAAALASGADGLDAIRRIVADASRHLVSGGWLLFEHGWNQGDAARDILAKGGYEAVFTAQDLERRDRVSGGRGPKTD